jgi:hypothetical protein
MSLALCLTLAGTCTLLILANNGKESSYRYYVENVEIYADSVTSFAQEIKNRFQPATVRITLSDDTELETIVIGFKELESQDKLGLLDYGNPKKRLKMYLEPSYMDLLMRRISVDKDMFKAFIKDVVMFDFESLKESSKPVIFR